MNKDTEELLQQYIITTLKDVNGISSDSYAIIKYLMKTDRNFASNLYETYEQCIESGNRYYVPADDFLN